MTQKGFFISISSILLFFFICFLQMASVLNSDFGWHIRMGQIILHSGIPHVDPLSYSMPSYTYIDNSWLADVLLFASYQIIGYNGLVWLCAFIYLFAIWIQIAKTSKYATLLPLLFTGLLCIPEASVRSQLFSFLFFSLLIKLVCDKKLWEKGKWSIPLLTMLWANLHGGFGIGIAVLILVIIIHTLEQKCILFSEWSILIFAILTTFVNPYGPFIWREQWIHIMSSQLKIFIEEWQPAFVNIMWDFWIFLPLSISVVMLYRKKLSPVELSLYTLMLMAAIGSVRNIPLWALIALPVTSKALSALSKDAQKIAFAKRRISVIYCLLLGAVIIGEIIPTAIGMQTLNNSWHETAYYPYQAVAYLNSHPPKQEVFAPLPWTGFLSWKFPQKRIFVDGRMVTWIQQNAPSNESSNAFLEYMAILDNKIPVKILITKYRINTFLLSTTILNDPGKKQFVEDIIRNNGTVVYKDHVATIYQTDTN